MPIKVSKVKYPNQYINDLYNPTESEFSSKTQQDRIPFVSNGISSGVNQLISDVFEGERVYITGFIISGINVSAIATGYSSLEITNTGGTGILVIARIYHYFNSTDSISLNLSMPLRITPKTELRILSSGAGVTSIAFAYGWIETNKAVTYKS